MPLCIYASMHLCRCASVPLCLSASVLLCLYVSLPMCLYVSLPLCLLLAPGVDPRCERNRSWPMQLRSCDVDRVSLSHVCGVLASTTFRFRVPARRQKSPKRHQPMVGYHRVEKEPPVMYTVGTHTITTKRCAQIYETNHPFIRMST